MERRYSFTSQLIFLAVVIGALALLVQKNPAVAPSSNTAVATTSQVSASGAALSQATSTATTTVSKKPTQSPSPATVKTQVQSQDQAPTDTPQVTRIDTPYTTPPLTPADVNITAKAALVNILCIASDGGLRPISGSGVIIDPRGVILTNAHVAQYVLLSESQRVNLKCFVRSGSPAAIHWVPRVLYIPPVWVREHAGDINADHPVGTGEHDYALLSIADSTDGSPLPSFPYLSPDTREAVAFVGDPVLVASYPAEFSGASASMNLYPASSFTTVQKFLTFTNSSVDVISVGSVIEAQSGSSGGAIANAWGRLVGVITTTSSGATTAERELRGITLSYVNRDLLAQTGSDLSTTLAGDPAAATEAFSTGEARELIALFIEQLTK